MERLPDIPLRKILKNISYEDLLHLIKVPDLRDTVLSFYKNEIHLRELEKRIIMDCIDDLETTMETNLFLELIDYFESKSYRDPRSLPEYDKIQKQFYDEILNLDIDEATRKILVDIQLEGDREISEIPYLLKKKKMLNDSLSSVIDKYQNKLDKLENDEMKRFKKTFFKGPMSYQNINEYLAKVKEYVDKYLVIDQSRLLNETLVIDQEQGVKQDFLKCIDTKMKNIRRIFRR